MLPTFCSQAAKPVNKSKKNTYVSHQNHVPIDLMAAVDSAIIMADDYAESLNNKPEMASVRRNALIKFAANRPKVVKDSICSRLYDLFVTYTENDKTQRADAFKDCFLSLASPNDPNLGALYSTELSLACENADTIVLKKYIPLLQDYSQRLNLDYDTEIYNALDHLNHIRTRPPIREAIVGVWVSEDIAGVNMPDGKTYWVYPEEKMNLINTTKILQIRNKDSEVYKGNAKYIGMEGLGLKPDSLNNANIDIIKQREGLSAHNILASTKWYLPIHAWELPAFNMQPHNQSYINDTSTNNYGAKFLSTTSDHRKEHYSRFVIADDNSYSIYAFWGDERLKRNNAELAAFGRQSIQTIQASIAGQLSRSKYDYGTQVVGNLTAGLVSAGLNALIDALMVSTDKIWSIETTLHLDNPNKLTAITTAQLIISKSNSTKPEVYARQHITHYYRWEPTDSIFFLPTSHHVYRPWSSDSFYGTIELHSITKAEKELHKKSVKDYSKKWEKWYKDNLKELKQKLKNCRKKTPEWNEIKTSIDNWQNNPPQMWRDWNAYMLQKLKNKAEGITNQESFIN